MLPGVAFGQEAQHEIRFNQQNYVVQPGGTFEVQVLIAPVPVSGLFSFGVKLLVDPAAARINGASAIVVSEPFSYDGPRAAFPVTADGEGFAAVKGTTDFFDPARPVFMETVLATFILTDLGGPDTYVLQLESFNTLGATEQVFVDGGGVVLDQRLIFGDAVVTRTESLTAAPVSSIALNRQSGLFQQTVKVTNLGSAPVLAFRLKVLNLPSSWQVWNAHGTADGVPWLAHNSVLTVGQSVDLQVELRIPSRDPQQNQPTYIAEPVPPTGEPGSPPGTSFEVIPRSQLADGAFLLEFNSLRNREYAIQYSYDLQNWTTVKPTVMGNGSRLQWIDYGPPKTDVSPSIAPTRYYRIFQLP